LADKARAFAPAAQVAGLDLPGRGRIGGGDLAEIFQDLRRQLIEIGPHGGDNPAHKPSPTLFRMIARLGVQGGGKKALTPYSAGRIR
jgi:hypothetical protein